MMPKLYTALADWWQLLSPRSDYREEAEIYRRYLAAGWEASAPPTPASNTPNAKTMVKTVSTLTPREATIS